MFSRRTCRGISGLEIRQEQVYPVLLKPHWADLPTFQLPWVHPGDIRTITVIHGVDQLLPLLGLSVFQSSRSPSGSAESSTARSWPTPIDAISQPFPLQVSRASAGLLISEGKRPYFALWLRILGYSPSFGGIIQPKTDLHGKNAREGADKLGIEF